MKFQDMPYERIDFAKVQEEMGELIRELEAAKSGEEQFEVHKKYYALTDRVMTLMTIANIRFDIDTSDKFYEEEHKYYDEQGRYSVISCWLIRRNYMNPHTERIWRRRSVR